MTSNECSAATDPRLCAAIVDRPAIGGKHHRNRHRRYRLAHTRADQQA
jgi:hypothetical protein